MLFWATSLAAAVASAETINVSWRIGMKKPEQYITAAPGDSLVFKWGYGHNVFIMDSCDESQFTEFSCPSGENESTNLGNQGPVTYNIPDDASGYLCFWCSYGGHCGAGQHMTVKLASDAGDGGEQEENDEEDDGIEIEWRIGMKKEEQYISAKPGDSLVFNYGGGHNVYQLNSCDGGKFVCPKDLQDSKFLGNKGPTPFKIPDDAKGPLCFWCTKGAGGHCKKGQHLTVKLPPAPIEIDWKIGMGAMAQSITAHPGQKLVFKWGQGHNVLLMKECDGAGDQLWSDFNCPTTEDDSTNLGEASPVEYTIPKEGAPAYLCFWCSIGGHCGAGQHSTVKVAGVGVEKPPAKEDGDKKAGKKAGKAGRKADKGGRKADKAARKAARKAGRRGRRNKDKAGRAARKAGRAGRKRRG